MRRPTTRPWLMLVGLLTMGHASAMSNTPQQKPAPATTTTRVDVSALGPQVGEQVPPFSLRDQSGQSWTQSSILGPNGALLVFFRSADW